MGKRIVLMSVIVLLLIVSAFLIWHFILRAEKPVLAEEYIGLPPLYDSAEDYRRLIHEQYKDLSAGELLSLAFSTYDPQRVEMELALLMRKEESLPIIRNNLLTGNDEERFNLLMLIQGHLRWKETAPEILLILRDQDASEDVRGTAATAAALFQLQESIPDIRNLLETADDPPAKWSAAISLGYLGDLESIGLLQTHLLQADSAYGKAVGAGVLGMLGSTVGEEQALELSRHVRYDIRIRAAEALSYIGTDKAMGRLQEMTESDPSIPVRIQSSEMLARAGLESMDRKSALAEIKRLLHGEDPPMWVFLYLVDYFAPESKDILDMLVEKPGILSHSATVAIIQSDAGISMIPYVRRPLK